MINDTYYCNTTGNPGIITSSGNAITIRFYSDAGLALQGFKIQFDCIGSENPPTPYFSAQPLNTCLGVVQFNDNSINNPQQWLWDFGDGNTSSEQNLFILIYKTELTTLALLFLISTDKIH